MEKKNGKICTICDKSFSSGKAMGGHMRSHFAKYPLPPKPVTNIQALDNSAELAHSPIQFPASQTFHPEKKQTHSFRSLKEFSASSNREREFDSYPKNPTRKRSKCRRNFIAVPNTKAEPKQMSLISETLPAEEAARTLLILSKDKWPESKEIKTPKMKKTSKKEGKDSEDGRDDCLFQTRSEARYKCKMCPKTFQSYQALGGHKANHKKIENIWREGGNSEDGSSGNNSDVVDQKVFECSSCPKVFKSAQALGRHKKVHLPNTMVTNSHNTANKIGGKFLDLNFPVPIEDGEVSPIESSTVSSEEQVL